MSNRPSSRQTVLVFDVNETLLDLKVMQPTFTEVFGHEGALKSWFMYLLQYSLVSTVTHNYHSFDEIGSAVIDMTAHQYQVNVPDTLKFGLPRMLSQLPPHPEVPQALSQLKEAGFRLVALSNSSRHLLKEQLHFAELLPFFDDLMSVEAIRLFKPHPQVYQAAAYRQETEPTHLRMIAAHAWDIAGAKNAGWKAAFVNRGGLPYYPLAPEADMVAPDLKEIAALILEKDK